MAMVANDRVFSIPFRYLWNTNLAGDLEVQDQQPTGLARFVGDQENQILRILAEPAADCFGESAIEYVWPLIFFGPTGTGKTSLAMNVISDVADQSSARPSTSPKQIPSKPIFLTALDFDRKFRAAMETDSVSDFRNRFLRCGGLVIDDVQKLQRKSAAQRELLRLIDEMLRRNRPIVVTMDEDPLQSEGLLPQLASRLSAGLSLSVRPPGYAARSVIIQDLCRVYELELSENAVHLLVDKLKVTVPKIVNFFRQLQTALRAKSKTGDATRIIDSAFITQMFDHSEDDRLQLTKTIIAQVAAEYQVKPSDLRSNSRKQSIVMARAIAVYLNRKLLRISFLKIGSLFGNRDHSTIMHANRKIEKLLELARDDPGANPAAVATGKKVEKLEQSLTNQFCNQINFI